MTFHNEDGSLSPGARFHALEKRVADMEQKVVDVRIELARERIKTAIVCGIANLIAFGLIEALAVHFGK